MVTITCSASSAATNIARRVFRPPHPAQSLKHPRLLCVSQPQLPPVNIISHRIVECTSNDLHLLVTCQLAEVHSIATNTDCEVGIFLRVLHCIHEHFPVEHVDIDVMATLDKVAVQYSCQVVGAVILTTLA